MRKKKKTGTQSIFRWFGILVVAYAGSVAWLEGPLAKQLFHGGPSKHPSLPVGADDRKLETKRAVSETKKQEEPNFLPRVLAFVFPQFHQDGKQEILLGLIVC